MSQYLNCAETAKLLRQSLKESFPGVKFSVKSSVYSGGASITVRWTDGPNSAQVKSVADQFSGAYFDGMIDYKGSKYHKLDGEEIRLGADFIFTERDLSDSAIKRTMRSVAAKYGEMEGATVQAYRRGELWKITPIGNAQGERYWSLDSLINRAIAKQSDRLVIEKSATLARLQFAGDDGYGAGTVGHNGEGGDQCYKAINEAQERQRAIAEPAANAPTIQ